MASITAAAGGGNWTAGATWVGGVAPTAADDALLTVASGNVTIDTGAVCRSLDCNGYTGVLTHNAAVQLIIGDGTAGAGSRALRLVAGMTYTLNSATTSSFVFSSTSATVQTITTAGKTLGNLLINGVGGSYQLADSLLLGATATFTMTNGTIDTNNQAVSMGLFVSNGSTTRVFTFGSSAITVTGTGAVWNVRFTGLTVTANTAVVTMTGSAAVMTHTSSAGSYNGMSVVMSGSGIAETGSIPFTLANFTRTGTAIATDALRINGTLTVTGIATFTGNSLTNRLLVQSLTIGTPLTLALAGATMTNTNVDFQDIIVTGSPTQNTTSVGNALGNTGITFTTPVTRYGVVAGNFSSTATWSATSGGAGGATVPLCHDTVNLDASSAAGTYTIDMVRLCADLNCTGFTRTLSTSLIGAADVVRIYGSVTWASGMTFVGQGNTRLVGRSTHTITSSGKTWPFTAGRTAFIGDGAATGSYTLQDAMTVSGSSSAAGIGHLSGTFDANGFSVTAPRFSSNTTATRTLTLGSGTWTLNGTTQSDPWTVSTSGLTFSGASATIVMGTSATNRTFAGGGLTYGTLTYTVAGSTGKLTLTGSNTFTTINFSDASNVRTLEFTAATTTSVTTFNVNGTAGLLMTIASATAANHTLSKASGTVSCDYLSISRSTATGGASWFAGANSTDGGNNTGWIFTAPGVNGTGVLSLGFSVTGAGTVTHHNTQGTGAIGAGFSLTGVGQASGAGAGSLNLGFSLTGVGKITTQGTGAINAGFTLAGAGQSSGGGSTGSGTPAIGKRKGFRVYA